MIIRELPRRQPAFLRPGEADGDIGFALRQAEDSRHGDKLDLQRRVLAAQVADPGREEVAAEAVGRADPDSAGDRQVGVRQLGIGGQRHAFHALGQRQKPLPLGGQGVAGRVPLEQAGMHRLLQGDEAPADGRVVRPQGSRRRGQLSRAGHGQEGFKVVPIEFAHDRWLISSRRRHGGGAYRLLMLLTLAEHNPEVP